MMAELRSHLLFRTMVSSSNSLGLFMVSKYTRFIIGPRHFLAFTCNQAIFRIWYSNWKIHDKHLTRVSFRIWYSNLKIHDKALTSHLQNLIFQFKIHDRNLTKVKSVLLGTWVQQTSSDTVVTEPRRQKHNGCREKPQKFSAFVFAGQTPCSLRGLRSRTKAKTNNTEPPKTFCRVLLVFVVPGRAVYSGNVHFLSSCLRCCSRSPSRWSARLQAAWYWPLSWVTTSSFFTMACFTLKTPTAHTSGHEDPGNTNSTHIRTWRPRKHQQHTHQDMKTLKTPTAHTSGHEDPGNTNSTHIRTWRPRKHQQHTHIRSWRPRKHQQHTHQDMKTQETPTAHTSGHEDPGNTNSPHTGAWREQFLKRS